MKFKKNDCMLSGEYQATHKIKPSFPPSLHPFIHHFLSLFFRLSLSLSPLFPFTQSSCKTSARCKERFAKNIKAHNLHFKFTMKIYVPVTGGKPRKLIFSGDICTP